MVGWGLKPPASPPYFAFHEPDAAILIPSRWHMSFTGTPALLSDSNDLLPTKSALHFGDFPLSAYYLEKLNYELVFGGRSAHL